jgi:vitamin B12 transporter
MKWLSLLILLFLLLESSAQVKILGRVQSNRSKPLAGISITLKDTYDGATTDSLGLFSFVTTEKGAKVLQATGTGYKEFEQQVTIADGFPITLNITLKELVTELKAVTITAGAFEASDSKRTTVLNSIDIVTTASANADVTSAIRTLPGTQQVGESEGLFVRGGTAGESKIFIDGTVVNNFFYSSVPDLAQRGRFSPFLFKGTVFSSGGYSAQYGQALSSVLLLESLDFPEHSSASLGISSVGVNGSFQKLSKDKKTSWGAGYNWTNLLPYFEVVKQKPDYFQVPDFHNAEFNYRTKTSKLGVLKFYGYFNYSRLGLRRPDIDSTSLKNAFGVENTNYYANLSWKEKIGKTWKLNIGLSYTNNRDNIVNELQDQANSKQDPTGVHFPGKNFTLNTKGEFAVAKAVFEKKLNGLNVLRFGGEYFYNNDRNFFAQNLEPQKTTNVKDHLKAGFAEVDLYATNDLAAKIGGRFEHSSLLKKLNVAPRVSVAYKLGEASQASVAYGMFYQKPDNANFLRGYSFEDPEYSKASHYIINYQKVTRAHTLRAELFYKKYHRLVKHTPTPAGPDKLSNTGSGDAKGFELFWRDRQSIKRFDYWVSYSYLDTKREFFNYPTLMKPNFAATHTASLVMKKFVSKMKTQFNASYTWASGRNYYNIRKNATGTSYQLFDQGVSRDYNNLSFSVNYLPKINKKGAGQFTVLVISVTNVLGNKQEFGYNYSANGRRKEVIGPAAPRFFFIGWFMSFGVDRTEDVINNNL